MSTFKKHVGRIKNTDKRCVVIYMQIPGNEDNALIVDTDALPDRFHDALMPLLDSVEGQSTANLYTLLSRRPFAGTDMLNALHLANLLRPYPIDNIIMYPAPNQPCPLRTIVDFVTGQAPKPETDSEINNRVLENQKDQKDEGKYTMAKGMLSQAEDLQREANRKREQAYKMYPGLRPSENDVSPEEGQTQLGAVPLADSSQEPVEGLESADAIETTVVDVVETVMLDEAETATVIVETIDQHNIFSVDVEGMPADVAEAFLKAQMDLMNGPPILLEEEFVKDNQFYVPEESTEDDEIEVAHEIDTSDDAIQAFLDRAALREDMANKEAWEAMQPKKPVGRPRKDGAPAGSIAPPPKRKPGRPRKDSLPPAKAKAKAKPKGKKSVK